MEKDEWLDKAERRLRRLGDMEAANIIADLLKQNSEKDSELNYLRKYAHAGVAVDVLGHQFESSIMNINYYLENISKDNMVERLKTHITEFIEYIRYLTPLQLNYPNYLRITGEDIKKYLVKFYWYSITKNNANIEFTESFCKMMFNVDVAKLYPSLICVITNSLYWTDDNINKHIKLNCDDNGAILISDNGPGVPIENIDKLFNLRFTTRGRGGKGIGLYLTKKHLKDMGFSIQYVTDHPLALSGANFLITPPKPLGL